MKASTVQLPFRTTFCLSLLLSTVASRCCGIQQWTRQAISDSPLEAKVKDHIME